MSVDPSHVDLDELASLIREQGTPVPINPLTEAAKANWRDHQPRLYAPGAHYTVGEIITFNGRYATITGIQAGHNAKQGHFQILELVFDDGSHKSIVTVKKRRSQNRLAHVSKYSGRISFTSLSSTTRKSGLNRKTCKIAARQLLSSRAT